MEEQKEQRKSIYGRRWEPVRKWFYSSWLIYELSIHFYDYAIAVHNYLIEQQGDFALRLGEMGTQASAIFCSVGTFIIYTFFLTVPAGFVLFTFFKTESLTGTQFERKIKKYF